MSASARFSATISSQLQATTLIPCLRLPATVLAAALLFSLVAGEVSSQCTGCGASGAWTGPGDTGADWGFQQIHLALLRGGVVNDTTYHSYILGIGETGGETEERGLFGWIPGDTTYAIYPEWVRLRRLSLPQTPDNINLFCAGHSTLADGRLLISGGHLGHDLGIEDALIFDPATRSWSPTGNTMHYPRWYPTNTTLPSGKVLTVAGSKWYKTLAFGGSPSVDSAYVSINDLRPARLRHPQIEWESPTSKPTPWPAEREGHVSAWFTYQRRLVVFGGRGTNGLSLDDAWAIDYTQQGAETYEVHDAAPIPGGPGPRYRPAGTGNFEATFMVVHGGKDLASGVVFDNLHRLAYVGNQWTWTPLSQSGSSLPGARWGHAAAWEDNAKKMVVFGGRPASGTGFADNSIYTVSVPLVGGSAVWQVASPSGGPTAREGHSLVWAQGDAFERDGETAGKWARLILFGGEDGSGLDNETWYLWYLPDANGTILEWDWEQGPTAPAARTRHSAFWDFSSHRMYLFGGDDGGASSVQDLWELKRVSPNGAALTWAPVTGSVPPGLAGQSVARVGTEDAFQPELFTPQGAGSYSDAFDVLGQPFYPAMFVLPSGKVLYPAINTFTYVLDTTAPPTGQWSPIQIIAGGTGDRSFWGEGAAMYLPGKVVKAGSDGSPGGFGPNQTAKLVVDIDNKTTGWVTGQPMTGTTTRKNHNLTILPNGKVLVSGGGNKNSEIWNPDANPSSWWSGYNDLAPNPVHRPYHSTVLLLPDGRILTAGGESGIESQQATIFTPPYLFNSQGYFASRPVILEGPCSIAYGASFEMRTSDIVGMASGTVALIRPGAVTHAYDQNQRYMPLSFVVCGDRLKIQAPANDKLAPPGDYMLFLVNGNGVPSIAKWMRVGSALLAGCDAAIPSLPIDPFPDLVSESEVWLYWGAAADDAPTSGTVTDYEVRQSGVAISDETAYCNAAVSYGQAQPPSPLLPPGNYQQWQVQGLSPNTTYHFAAKARDESWNWGPISGSCSATTLPWWGGGGGGFSAQRVTGEFGSEPGQELADDPSAEAATARSGRDATSNPMSVVSRTGEPLAVEMRLEAGRRVWTIHHLDETAATDLAGADGATIILQVPGADGAWQTHARFHPGANSSRFGLRSAARSRRYVFLRPVSLDLAAAAVDAAEGGAWKLAEARHSLLGDVTTAVNAAGGYDLGLVAGETLTLAYEADASEGESVTDCFVFVGPSGTSAGLANRRRSITGEQAKLPNAFALHQNQPNPFVRFTTIRFDLALEAEVRLAVFDAQGRRVRSLVGGRHPAGFHTLEWDRRDEAGREVDAGVYLYRLEAGVFRSQRKMVLLP